MTGKIDKYDAQKDRELTLDELEHFSGGGRTLVGPRPRLLRVIKRCF